MNIRTAENTDASKIKSLVSSLSCFYLEDGNATLPTWFANTLELSEFKKRLTESAFKNFVYVENNKILGYISIKNENHLYHLFVDEKHQGKGIAKKLWNHAKSKTDASLYSVRSSIFAIPVYESFGFKQTGPTSIKDGISFQTMELVD